MNPRPLGPEPSALPNCATPRFYIGLPTGRSTTPWSLVAARLFPPTFSLRKNVRPFGGASSSQKSRSRRSLRFSGALCRARCQTALHLDFILVYQQVVPRPLGPSSPHASFCQRFPCGKTFGCSAAPPLPKNLARLAHCDFREPCTVRATKLRYTSILYWSSNRSFRDLLVPRHPPYQKNSDDRQQANLLKSALLFYHMQFALSNIVALLERNIFGKRKSITAV